MKPNTRCIDRFGKYEAKLIGYIDSKAGKHAKEARTRRRQQQNNKPTATTERR